jgi:superfamily II DNA or RNA helicase/DNA modification methylase
MRIDHRTGGRSIVHLDEYADLLAVRSLPDYRFTGETSVEVDTSDLAFIGQAPAINEHTFHPSAHLFDYQAWIVRRAVERERFAIFAGTGLGKTAMGLDWARIVGERHHGRTLIVAPLNVIRQWIAEAERFYGDTLTVTDCSSRATLREWCETGHGVGITNWEKFDGMSVEDTNDVEVAGGGVVNLKYQAGDVLPVDAVILDESSALKSFGSRKFAIMRSFDGVRYKLCLSATPAPNQRTEFAQHALFLGYVRSTTEYLTAYFVNRDGDWEMKPHAHDAWIANLASWGVFLTDPRKWGFTDYDDLPELRESFPQVALHDEQTERARRYEVGSQPSLFGATPGGITSRTRMMQIAHGFELDGGNVVAEFTSNKPQWIADKAAEFGHEQVIVWVTFDYEGDRLEALIPDSCHLSGRTSRTKRDDIIEQFRKGEGPRVLILKPAMFGFGVNLQSCHIQIFSTITDSFERYWQCVRRSLRYGQDKPVSIFIPLTQLDEAICQNTMNKQSTFLHDSARIEDSVVQKLRPADTSEVRSTNISPLALIDRRDDDLWTMIYADSVAHLPTVAPHTFDMCIFSPPFAALYAYSKALGDMGNVRADAEFRLQWRWFAEALLPTIKPGRIVAIHSKEIIRFANTHGYRHCYDFPSDLRDGFVAAGFNYQRRITIWKNPQLEATRNKETSLLHVTALRDAANSMPQTGEYLMIFTAPGKNETPIEHSREAWTFEHHTEVMNSIWPEPATPAEHEAEMWRQLVHPDNGRDIAVWDGIRETDVLTASTAKDSPEEKHVCPLQLGLIDRAVQLWSNPGELILSPFGGIGSEGHASLLAGRRFYGIELKESYWRTACNNLARAAAKASAPKLFAETRN